MDNRYGITIEQSDDPEIREMEDRKALDEIFENGVGLGSEIPETMRDGSLKRIYVLAAIGLTVSVVAYLAFYAIKRIYL